MIKKSLRNAAASTAALGVVILPGATTIAPQMELMACKYPRSIVTDTEVIYPTVINARTVHTARVNVDGLKGPNGRVRFRVGKQDPQFAQVRDGKPVKFKFGGNLRGGRTYTIRAKFFGNCKYRNSSDQVVISVLKHR